MMRLWCNILPMFIVRWYAKNQGERFYVEGIGTFVNPFGDVLIVIKMDADSGQ